VEAERPFNPRFNSKSTSRFWLSLLTRIKVQMLAWSICATVFRQRVYSTSHKRKKKDTKRMYVCIPIVSSVVAKQGFDGGTNRGVRKHSCPPHATYIRRDAGTCPAEAGCKPPTHHRRNQSARGYKVQLIPGRNFSSFSPTVQWNPPTILSRWKVYKTNEVRPSEYACRVVFTSVV
jgi:hypothetical protein